MKQKSVLSTIKQSAATGTMGNMRVRAIPTTLFAVGTLSGSARWLIDGTTGIGLTTVNDDGVGMVARNLCTAIHATETFEIKACNTATKWVETTCLTLPMSAPGVTQYSGKFTAANLDFHDAHTNSPKSASELIGLGEAQANTQSPRLWNVTGSEPHNGGIYDRKLVVQYGVLEFSSSSGEYRFTKSEAANELLPVLVGTQPSDVASEDILEALKDAPQTTTAELFASIAHQFVRRG